MKALPSLIILEYSWVSYICTMLKSCCLWNGHPSIHSNPCFMTNLSWCSFMFLPTWNNRRPWQPKSLFANAMHLHCLPFSIFVKTTPSPVSLKESIWMTGHILDLPTTKYHWKVQVWVRILGGDEPALPPGTYDFGRKYSKKNHWNQPSTNHLKVFPGFRLSPFMAWSASSASCSKLCRAAKPGELAFFFVNAKGATKLQTPRGFDLGWFRWVC